MSRKYFSNLLIAVSVVALSGCAEWKQHMRDTLPQPTAAYAEKEIVVAPTRSEFPVHFEDGQSTISATETSWLKAFLNRVSTERGKTVVLIEQPSRKADRLSRARAIELTRMVRSMGYQTDVYAVGTMQANTLRIAVDHVMAMVPGCPDWQFHDYFAFGSQPLPNQGCSDRTNLAAMVANPEDLVVGAVPHDPSGHGPLYGEVRYEQNAVTPLEEAKSTGGFSSEN